MIAILMAGCEGDHITNNIQTPESTVDVSVSGRVFAGSSGDLIAGASCKLIGTGISATSDAQGIYSMRGLSEGTYTMMVSSPGYATTSVPMTITMNNVVPGTTKLHLTRDVVLAEKTASLTLRILKPSDGDPASGADVNLQFNEVAYGQYVDDPTIVSSGTTNAEGQVTFGQLPAVGVTVVVQPYDANDDGQPDYGTTVREVGLVAGKTTQLTMALYAGSSTVEVVATNIPPSYYSGYVQDPVMFLVFSTTMDSSPVSTHVTLKEYYSPYAEVPVTAQWVSGTKLEISPDLSYLEDETRYTLSVQATSTGGIRFSRSWNEMFDIGGVGGGGDCSDVVTDLAATSVDPMAEPLDYDTRVFKLSWTAVPCARGYHIYAKDDLHNDHWVYVTDEPTDYEWGTITSIVTLPESFDRYGADSIITPLAGTRVTFAVVPIQADDGNPDNGHGTADVTDGTAPSITAVRQYGSAWNVGDQESQLVVEVAFSEFLSPTTAQPQVTIVEAGGDPTFTLNPADGYWTWRDGRHRGEFVISVPANTDATGDEIRFSITDMSDLTGNTVPGITQTDPMPLTTSSYFDFEEGPEGWTNDGAPDCWEWGMPSTGPRGGNNSDHCWGTDLDANYGNNLSSSVTSPLIGVPSSSPVLRFYAWWYLYTDAVCEVSVGDGAALTKLGEFRGSSNSSFEWRPVEYPLDFFAGQKVRIVLKFTSLVGSTAHGFFFDDVEVVSSP